MIKINRTLFTTTFILLISLLLAGLIKGSVSYGIIDYQQAEAETKQVGSPFESSGSSSRYALTQAIVEDKTLFLDEKRAEFASPDVSKYNDKYFTIFTPGISFFGVPFYWAGKQIGLPQLFTYASTSAIAVLSTFFVARIARRLGAGFFPALIAGFLYLFASSALAYSLSFTQHILSSFLILLAALNALGERSVANNIWFGALFGFGVLVDIPNGLMMLPLLIYVLFRQLEIDKKKKKYDLKLKTSVVGLLIGLIPMLALFGWYNYKLTGSYTRVAQSIGRAGDFAEEPFGNETQRVGEARVHIPFNTRNLLAGLPILLTSNQRGIIFYSPILLLGAVGAYLLYKNEKTKSIGILLASVVFTNLLVYASFSDPTGSWAFGPRYLIPGAAILSVFAGVAIDRFRKKPLFALLFVILVSYSIGINVLGAMTTTMVPPKIEAVNLPNPIPYTYKYNWQLMVDEGLSSSLFYNLYLSDKFTSEEYLAIYAYIAFSLVMSFYVVSFFERRKAKRL